MDIQVIGVRDLPLIQRGDDLPALICEKVAFEDGGDILTVASSVYSKAKGFTRELAAITPGAEAVRIAAKTKEDPRFVQAVLDSSTDILLEYPFILSELPSGHIGVRAGVDHSNVEDGRLIILPPDPPMAPPPRSGTLSAASPERTSG